MPKNAAIPGGIACKGLDLHVLTVAKKPDDQGAIAHLNEAEQKVRAAGFNPVCQILQGDPEKVIRILN